MKPGNTFDKEALLFDYMEGNLSEDQRRYVETLLLQDPALKEELILWQNAVVSEELPATVAVNHLYRPLSIWKKPVFFASILLVVISSVTLTFGYLWTSDEVDKSTAAQPAIQLKATLPSDQSDHAVEGVANGKPVAQTVEERPEKHVEIRRRKPQPGPVLEKASAAPEEIKPETELPKPDTIPADLKPDTLLTVPPVPVQKQVEQVAETLPASQRVKPESAKQKLTKAEKKKQRQIARMKRRALERKEQQQFMKGNKPYVVPPDLKNF